MLPSLKTCFLASWLCLLFLSHSLADLKIGWIGPLTGNAAVLGVDSAPAVQLAVDEINANGGIGGQQLRLFIEDDQYETAKTVSAYHKLVHGQGVKLLIVVTYGGVFALAERAVKDGVIILDPLDCDSALAALPRNILCVAKRTESLGNIIAEEILARKLFPVALLYFDGDPFMGTVAQAFRDKLGPPASKLSVVQTYNNSSTDFKSFLAAARAQKSQALVLLGYDQLASVIRSARELKMPGEIFGLATLVSPPARKIMGSSADGSWVAVWKAQRSDSYQAFSEKLRQRTGRSISQDAFAVPPYDTLRLLASALQHSGSVNPQGTFDTAKVLDALYSNPGFSGISGTIGIAPDGAATGFSNMGLFKIQGDELQLIRESAGG